MQGEKAANAFRLNKVGVTGVVKPVQVRRPRREVTLTTTMDVFVDLPPEQKGSHLSRNLEAINEVVDRSVRDPVGSLEELTETIARSLLKRHDYATTSEVWATAVYFLERTSPWGRTSLEPYRLVARANARRGSREVERSIGVE
ncbi:MAG: GTP cyclohydrolase, FolE2/MptA family, partial [Thermoplasmata archaeon]